MLKVRYYQCGHCTNRLGMAYKGESFSKVRFPSGVFLIEHPSEGKILFDTGYTRKIMKSGCAGWLYRKANPVSIRQDEEINTQLSADGIKPDDIRYVILSHLHPDHIGGVEFFANSRFLLSKKMYENYLDHKKVDLIFDSLLPEWFSDQIQILEDSNFSFVQINGLTGYDIFGDSSLVIVSLDGHAYGHIGALIPDKILLAGDSCWRNSLVSKPQAMRKIMNIINNNQHEYIETLSTLEQLRNNKIQLCFSHEFYDSKEILNG